MVKFKQNLNYEYKIRLDKNSKNWIKNNTWNKYYNIRNLNIYGKAKKFMLFLIKIFIIFFYIYYNITNNLKYVTKSLSILVLV